MHILEAYDERKITGISCGNNESNEISQPLAIMDSTREGRSSPLVDELLDPSDGSDGAGMVLRNSTGRIIFAVSQLLFHWNDPLEAELHAIAKGMVLVVEWSILPAVL